MLGALVATGSINFADKHTSRTHNLGGLTTLLAIFLFLIYLFIRLDVSVYVLMIYKGSKIRA